jgi:hypothetical protein
MPVLAAILYWMRILRRPIEAWLKRRYIGEFALGFGAAALVSLWLEVRPTGFQNSYFWGELTGGVCCVGWAIPRVRRLVG